MLKWLQHLPVPLLILAGIWFIVRPPTTSGYPRTQDGFAAQHLARFFNFYSSLEEGKIATSWGELRDKCRLELDDRKSGVNLAGRYAIISPPVALAGELNGHLVAMNRSSIYDRSSEKSYFIGYKKLNGPGRYIVYQGLDGRFHDEWVTEKFVQTLFKGANRSLPVVDHEPERSWVAKVRWTMYLWRFFGIVVILGAIYQIWYDEIDWYIHLMKEAVKKRLPVR